MKILIMIMLIMSLAVPAFAIDFTAAQWQMIRSDINLSKILADSGKTAATFSNADSSVVANASGITFIAGEFNIGLNWNQIKDFKGITTIIRRLIISGIYTATFTYISKDESRIYEVTYNETTVTVTSQ